MPTIAKIIGNRPIAAWNSKYDYRLLQQSCEAVGLDFTHTEVWCVMEGYKMYAGLDKCVKLQTACQQMFVEPGKHRALGDARAAAGVLQGMAKGQHPDWQVEQQLASHILNPIGL